MPHTLSISINPNCLDQVQDKKNVSARQNTFIESVKDLHDVVKLLKKKQDDVQFDEKQAAEISRGAFYALTPSLENKFLNQSEITLHDLQSVLNKEFQIQDEQTINFIIKSLLLPHSLPFELSILAYSVLTDDSCWSNECTARNPTFKYSLKAKRDISGSIVFNGRMNLRNAQFPKRLSLGSLILQFSIDQQREIKLLPLTMQFNFASKNELEKFKKELCTDFRDWIFQPKTHWQTTDLWVIPVLLGCLVGLIAMISLLALGVTPISPLLLPPLGLALGLCLASLMHSYDHMSIKKEQEKFQRPIHLFNRVSVQTSAFFNRHRVQAVVQCESNDRQINVMASSRSGRGHP